MRSQIWCKHARTVPHYSTTLYLCELLHACMV